MKRRALVLVAAAVALSATMVTPVRAHFSTIRGDMELTLLAEQCPDDGRFLTWAGTVSIDGEVYGWADFPTAEPVAKRGFLYFQEYWTIFHLGDEQPGVESACDPARVLMDGTNRGIGTPWFSGFAWGTVATTADDGPFDGVAVGSPMFWRGHLPEQRDAIPGDPFVARLRIISS